jgi:tetratricopeptide (TPR) repeat protein
VKPGWDTAAVPDTVERVFAARLDALPVASAGLLQVASVIGRTVRLSLLEAVAGSEPGWLQHVEALVGTGLLDRLDDSGEGAITFHHGLLHDVVYGRLLRRRRRELHRRVADVARALYGDGDDSIGLLARHLYLAEAGAEAVAVLLRAGRRAAALYANDEAAMHLERAVEVLRTLPEAAAGLPAVLLELAEVQQVRGAYDEALPLFSEAHAVTGDVRALCGMAAVLRKRGQYDEALQVLDGCPEDQPLLARERAYSLDLTGRAEEAQRLLGAALTSCAQISSLRGGLLTQLASVQEGLQQFASARAVAAEAIEVLARVEDHAGAVAAHRVAGTIELKDGHLEAAAGHLTTAQELALRTGLVEESAGILMILAWLRMEQGDAERAVLDTLQAIQIFEMLGHGSGRAVGYGNVADWKARLEQWDEAEQWAVKAHEYGGRIQHAGTLADSSLTLAKVACARGRFQQARTWTQEAAEHLRRVGAHAEADAALLALEQALQARAERPR